jgi:lysophospholipid acyltransferase (LPLAT)-like uncharacterized protein
MIKKIKNYYQVDNVPLLLNIPLTVLSYSFALLLRLYFLLVKNTSRITIEGEEYLQGNYIFCHWHQNIAAYFSAFSRPKNQVWMQHPFWYMKPIHALLSLYGIRYVLGSSGNKGKVAADELCRNLQQGFSTTIFPDGPAGPAKELKKGILHIAQQSGIEVVALQFEVKRSLKINSWDNKFLPLPFNHILVSVSAPIKVTECDDVQADIITRALNSV